jgi:formylglycine-generating enzyme required for sulfatase activity
MLICPACKTQLPDDSKFCYKCGSEIKPESSDAAGTKIGQTAGYVAPGGVMVGQANCADFIGRDKVSITYGYSAKDVERLIEKVLTFLQAGAVFLPPDQLSGEKEVLRAEVDGETLSFRPKALSHLSNCRSERAYLLSLIVRQEYQYWATMFVPLAGQMEERRLDIPIAFREFRLPPEGADPGAQPTSIPLKDITEARERYDAFILLGEPGCGKTTTLRKIAYESAYKLLIQKIGYVPLFVRLSQQGSHEPYEFLRTEWERRTGSSFADALANQKILILADGINELPRQQRNEQLKAWKLFAADYASGNQIIFTSRSMDYQAQLDLPRVVVEPLDDERIADYLQRNQATGLDALLDAPHTRLRQMARNPLNLCMLVAAYLNRQHLLSNRGKLLEWFVGQHFERERLLAHPGWLEQEVQVEALSTMAYAMQEQGVSLTFPYQTARDALPQAVDWRGEQHRISPPELFRFGRSATVLDPMVEPDVRFFHQLYQEYFAARELLRRFGSGEDLSRLWTACRLADKMPPAQVGEWNPLPPPPPTDWEETIILACGLASTPPDLIEAIRSANPILAGRCLDEAGIERPAELLPRVRTDLLADLGDPAVHLRARLQSGLILGRIGDPRFQAQQINGVKVILPQMVDVPAGRYTIGSAEDDPQAYSDESPQHELDLSAFAIGRWPVTNAEFACFIEAGGYQNEDHWQGELARRWLRGEDVMGGQYGAWLDVWKSLQSEPGWKEQLQSIGLYSPQQIEGLEYVAGLSEEELKDWLSQSLANKSRQQPGFWKDADRNNPSQPVVGVTWFEAQAYCAWLTSLTGRLFCLPTEFDWEAAARGLPPSPFMGEGLGVRVYPWGNDWDAEKANTLEGRVLKPSPVGAFSAAGGVGPFGAEDQSGNAFEWTASWYQVYPGGDPHASNVFGEKFRVVRGGSWNINRRLARCAYRDRYVPGDFYYDVGFRVFSPGSF